MNNCCTTVTNMMRSLLLLLLLLLFSQMSVRVWGLNYTNYRHVSSLRLDRIHKHLGNINKPPVFTIESPDGDIIDCVHKRKQPALDHPLLKNHKIQRVAPERPKMKMMMKEDQVRDSVHKNKNISERGGTGGAWQTWHQTAKKCPKGTVPIRRSTVHDVLRANSLYDFGKKRRRGLPQARRTNAPDVVSGNGHEKLNDIVRVKWGSKAETGFHVPK